jgi:hypothetical protein
VRAGDHLSGRRFRRHRQALTLAVTRFDRISDTRTKVVGSEQGHRSGTALPSRGTSHRGNRGERHIERWWSCSPSVRIGAGAHARDGRPRLGVGATVLPGAVCTSLRRRGTHGAPAGSTFTLARARAGAAAACRPPHWRTVCLYGAHGTSTRWLSGARAGAVLVLIGDTRGRCDVSVGSARSSGILVLTFSAPRSDRDWFSWPSACLSHPIFSVTVSSHSRRGRAIACRPRPPFNSGSRISRSRPDSSAKVRYELRTPLA